MREVVAADALRPEAEDRSALDQRHQTEPKIPAQIRLR
jgi:hypothetical protein